MLSVGLIQCTHLSQGHQKKDYSPQKKNQQEYIRLRHTFDGKGLSAKYFFRKFITFERMGLAEYLLTPKGLNNDSPSIFTKKLHFVQRIFLV